MNEFLSSHLPAVRSLAGIAHDILTDTRDTALSKARDIRVQVAELWDMAEELPRAGSEKVIRHVRSALDVLKARDSVVFPKLARIVD